MRSNEFTSFVAQYRYVIPHELGHEPKGATPKLINKLLVSGSCHNKLPIPDGSTLDIGTYYPTQHFFSDRIAGAYFLDSKKIGNSQHMWPIHLVSEKINEVEMAAHIG
jgi:hypothetical protein